MSRDEVDNLHAAEDHIGCLETWMKDAADMLRADAVKVYEECGLDLQPVLDKLIVTPYCRLDCENGECSDDCGCQAHGDDPHPGWVRRHTLEVISEEFACGFADPDDEDEWALVEYNANTSEHHVTMHVDGDSAIEYVQQQDDGWAAVWLINLDSGERLKANVERTVTVQFVEIEDEAVTACK